MIILLLYYYYITIIIKNMFLFVVLRVGAVFHTFEGRGGEAADPRFTQGGGVGQGAPGYGEGGLRHPYQIHTGEAHGTKSVACVCVCVLLPFILDVRLVGRTSQGHAGGRSHRISHPPSFCGACLNFSREKDSAVHFPRRP